MEYYLKKVDNFFNLLSNNFYNEYSKNKILQNKVKQYKDALDFKIFKCIKKTDNMILNSFEKIYNLYDDFYIQRETNIPQYYGGYFKRPTLLKSTFSSKEKYEYAFGLERYRNNLYNSLRHFIFKFKFYFNDSTFSDIENKVISNLEDESQYTSDGLMDYLEFKNRFINKYGPIIDIRNIENIRTSFKGNFKIYTYTFELTLKSQKRITFLCTADILIGDKHKIDSFNYDCLDQL